MTSGSKLVINFGIQCVYGGIVPGTSEYKTSDSDRRVSDENKLFSMVKTWYRFFVL